MVVEFVGLPGAGKTTVQSLTWSALAGKHRGSAPIHPRMMLGVNATAELASAGGRLGRLLIPLRYPRLTILILRELLSSERVVADRIFFARLMLVTLQRYILAQEMSSSVTLFDEGICQRGLMLFWERDRTPSTRSITRYLDLAPCPDLIVHLRVNPVVSIERVSSRREQKFPRRFWGATPAHLQTILNGGDAMLKEFTRYMESEFGVKVLEFDAGVENPSAISDMIAEYILDERVQAWS